MNGCKLPCRAVRVTVTPGGIPVYHVPVGLPGNPQKLDFSGLFSGGGGNFVVGK